MEGANHLMKNHTKKSHQGSKKAPALSLIPGGARLVKDAEDLGAQVESPIRVDSVVERVTNTDMRRCLLGAIHQLERANELAPECCSDLSDLNWYMLRFIEELGKLSALTAEATRRKANRRTLEIDLDALTGAFAEAVSQ